jgi:hypothetical protein
VTRGFLVLAALAVLALGAAAAVIFLLPPGAKAVLAVLAGAGAWYGHSVWRHPMRPCWACKGSRSHRDGIWKGAFGNCLACKGRGIRIRWGVRLFTPATAKAIRNGQHGRNY